MGEMTKNQKKEALSCMETKREKKLLLREGRSGGAF